MKEIKRVVSTSLWRDDTVLDEYSPEDKYFLLYLLTNPDTTQLGIYHLPIRQAAFDTGYSVETIKVLLDRFENKYKNIKYSSETNEVAIKNFLKHSIVKGGKPVFDCLTAEAENVKDKSLLSFIYTHLRKEEPKDLNATVVEFLDYLTYIENEKENENDNDNDNERYVNESYHESYDESSVEYQEILDEFHSICVDLPKVHSLSDKRKKAIKLRCKKYSMIELVTAFEKIQASDFCSGRNGGWRANFDWIFKNDDNILKVLEGVYDNRGTTKKVTKSINWDEV